MTVPRVESSDCHAWLILASAMRGQEVKAKLHVYLLYFILHYIIKTQLLTNTLYFTGHARSFLNTNTGSRTR